MSQEIKSLSDYKKQQAIDRLKEWPMKKVIVGVIEFDNETYHVDATIVCNDEQLEKNKQRFIAYRLFELKEVL